MTIEEAENTGAVSEDGHFMTEGSILDQKYVIGSERLSGGMAVVYRATGLLDKHERAVKVPLPIADAELSSLSFRREERALSDLSHKNIVRLVDGGNIHNALHYSLASILSWLDGHKV